MPTIEMRIPIEEAIGRLESGAEVILDFSPVMRIDAAELRMMERLAETAEAKGAKVVLAGVNVDVYRALKLARLAARFRFAG